MKIDLAAFVTSHKKELKTAAAIFFAVAVGAGFWFLVWHFRAAIWGAITAAFWPGVALVALALLADLSANVDECAKELRAIRKSMPSKNAEK